MNVVGQTIVAGSATGIIQKLTAPLSFWGGLDPATGTIIDQAHPEAGTSLAGKIVAMPGSRGSSGTPGVLGESIRRGTGPIGMILTKPDVNLAAGSMAAATLYGTACPIILADQATFDTLNDGAAVTIG